jgi:hypothetical protein
MAQDSFDAIVNAVMLAESGGRRFDKQGNLLTSSKGAQGEMQVMPGTAKSPGYGVAPAQDKSPEELARVGRDYLKSMLDKYGDVDKALAAYNWGPGNTDKWIAAGADPKKLPSETRSYIDKIKSTLGGERVAAESGPKPEAAPVPAAAAGAPQRAPVKAAPVARTADLGTSYQAALALSFLADEAEREDRGREYDEREPSTAQKWLASTKPSMTPEMLAMPYRSPFGEEQEPVRAADGGFIAVGYKDGGEAKRRKIPDPSLANFSLWAETVSRDMYPARDDNVKRDAARHMLASAYLANRTSPGFAEGMGKAYEFKEAPFKTLGHWMGVSAPRSDYSTDTRNNALGASMAELAKNPDALRNAVRASIERGEASLTPDEISSMGYNDTVYDPKKAEPVKKAEGGEAKAPDRASARGMMESLKSGEGAQAFLRGLTMLPQNIAGAPVDLATLAMRPFGYSVEKPVGGSEWLKEKSRAAGVAFQEPTDPNARALYTAGDIASNLINPAGATRAAVRGAKELGSQASSAAKMLKDLKPPSGPDLAPAGVPAEMARAAKKEKTLEELVSAPMEVAGSRRDWERISEGMRAEVEAGKSVSLPKEDLMKYVQPIKPVSDGLEWVKITDPLGLVIEGGAMNHSINRYASKGGYGHGGLDAFLKGTAEVYSLRNPKTGRPLVTMEVFKYGNGDRWITQIKGPSNSDPSRFRQQIFEFMDDPNLKVLSAKSESYRNTPTGGDLAEDIGVWWQHDFDDWKVGMLDYRHYLDEK